MLFSVSILHAILRQRSRANETLHPYIRLRSQATPMAIFLRKFTVMSWNVLLYELILGFVDWWHLSFYCWFDFLQIRIIYKHNKETFHALYSIILSRILNILLHCQGTDKQTMALICSVVSHASFYTTTPLFLSLWRLLPPLILFFLRSDLIVPSTIDQDRRKNNAKKILIFELSIMSFKIVPIIIIRYI